ncbi:acyl-CoA desaturase [bacterium]|nr:acyl-CoA desaturase [bacterium]
MSDFIQRIAFHGIIVFFLLWQILCHYRPTFDKMLPRMSENSATTRENHYVELKRMIEVHGLLVMQPFYYFRQISLNLLMFAAGVLLLFWTDNLWFRLLDAVFLGFVATQSGFIAHDAGHGQIFKSPWKNHLIGLLNNVLLGASYFWWVDTHNKHHSKPNQVSNDPAIDYSVIAFSNEAALSKKGILRIFVKYQAFLFLPMMFLYPVAMRIDSVRFLLRSKSKYRLVDAVLIALHFVLYFWLIFGVLDLWMALLFIVVHQSLFGLYLAFVFAPNHMGMVILEKDTNLDFLTRQVITARNVKGGRLTDFFFGGLNLQIEHHLFPRMARNKLRVAKKIVEDFCRKKSIRYYETGVVQSYAEIFKDLHRVSRALRRSSRAPVDLNLSETA